VKGKLDAEERPGPGIETVTESAEQAKSRRDRLRSLVAMANAHNLPAEHFTDAIEREDDATLRALLAGIREPNDFGAAARREAVSILIQERLSVRVTWAMETLDKELVRLQETMERLERGATKLQWTAIVVGALMTIVSIAVPMIARGDSTGPKCVSFPPSIEHPMPLAEAVRGNVPVLASRDKGAKVVARLKAGQGLVVPERCGEWLRIETDYWLGGSPGAGQQVAVEGWVRMKDTRTPDWVKRAKGARGVDDYPYP